MDAHTLDLLEFDKIRSLVAARAACSLGKQAAMSMEPSTDLAEVHHRQAITTEMVEAIRSRALSPAWAVCTTFGHTFAAPRSAPCSSLRNSPRPPRPCRPGRPDRWLSRVGDQFPRLGGLRAGVGEFSGVTTAIEGCLDSRAKVLDTASRRLSVLRREIGLAEGRIQETLRRMVRSPEIKRILRYPNFTMVGHHYVLPVAKDHRGEVQGSVQRTSATNETVYIEPTAIAEQSAQLSYSACSRSQGDPPDPPLAERQVGMVAEPLLQTLGDHGRAGPDPCPGQASAVTTGCRPPT